MTAERKMSHMSQVVLMDVSDMECDLPSEAFLRAPPIVSYPNILRPSHLKLRREPDAIADCYL
jgi:hypothetical protein